MAKEKTNSDDIEISATAGGLYLLTVVAQKEEALKTLEKHLEGKGEIVKSESLGKRQLAYPINKHKELFLLSVFFTAEPAGAVALDKELLHEDEVERYLITTWRGDVSKENSETKFRVRRERTRERVTV